MRSVRDGLHNWVVGGVADRRLGEDFDEGIQGCQVYVPSFMVTVEAFYLASCFFGVLLGVGSEFVKQSIIHDAVVGHDVGRWLDYVLDIPLEICDD